MYQVHCRMQKGSGNSNRMLISSPPRNKKDKNTNNNNKYRRTMCTVNKDLLKVVMCFFNAMKFAAACVDSSMRRSSSLWTVEHAYYRTPSISHTLRIVLPLQLSLQTVLLVKKACHGFSLLFLPRKARTSHLFGSHKWIQIPHSNHDWGLGLVGDLT